MPSLPILLLAGLRLGLVLLLLLGGVLCVAILFPWLGWERRATIKRRWSVLLLGALGLLLGRAGTVPPAGPALLVANHVSFLDIFVIDALLPATFVAKSEVAGWPVIGWLTRRTGNLFIERGSRQAAQLTLARLADALAAGRRVTVFPEGTTTDGTSVLPFHAALLQAAIDSGAPVVCLALNYRTAEGAATAAPAYVGDDSLWDCLWRIVAGPGFEARLMVAGSLPGLGTDRRHLARHAHVLVTRAVEMLQRPDCNVAVTRQPSACHAAAEECDASELTPRRASWMEPY